MSHALDCELFGLDAGGHHFTSLLLRAIDAVILFLLLSRHYRQNRAQPDGGRAVWVASGQCGKRGVVR
jgi:hypothetical protein